jgi:hypothetical protein
MIHPGRMTKSHICLHVRVRIVLDENMHDIDMAVQCSNMECCGAVLSMQCTINIRRLYDEVVVGTDWIYTSSVALTAMPC